MTAEATSQLHSESTWDLSGLFTPCRLKHVRLPNRFIMPAMQRGWCRDGAPLAELADYYRRRIEGGVGLVIGESCAVHHPTATAQPAAAWLTPQTVPAWARCVDAVRGAGGLMLLQLWHEGGLRNAADGRTISPSGCGRPGEPNGRAVTPTELSEVRDAYVESAALAQSIGAAGIEIHACHGYLLDQFLWSRTNLRDDCYGGSDIRQRARFPAEVVAAIRAQCGPDFLISFRFSQWKESDYQARIVSTPKELRALTNLLRSAGVDVFHASTRRFWMPEWSECERGLAGWTRHLSGAPTIIVGSLGLNRDVMDSLLGSGETRLNLAETLRNLAYRYAAGEFDLVSVGRSLIADPDWVRKVREGRWDEIRVFRKQDIESLRWEE